MGAFERIEARLEAGGPVILDGAIGTELERLGARMDEGVWCARALADSPDMVHEVHRRYLDAGADVITANSYSATREAMERHGLAEHFEDWNRRAARIALEERDRSPRSGSVAVAGSGDHVHRRLGRPHDALGTGRDRGRGQGPAWGVLGAGRCVSQRRLLDAAELGLRRPGIA